MQVIELSQTNLTLASTLAAQTVLNGGIVVLPFDTVYGFICNPTDSRAIQNIFAVKKRNLTKPIGVAVDSYQQMNKIAFVDNPGFIKSRIPGPYTFILRAKETDYSEYCMKNRTIAVRIPDSKLVLNLINLAGGAIAQTSANQAGLPDCGSFNDFIHQFGPEDLEKVDLFIDGGMIAKPQPSQIFDLTQDSPRKIDR